MRAITPFNVILGHQTNVGTNRKPVCDFLLVINTDIISRSVSKLLQIDVEILNEKRSFCPLGVLTTYTVHLRLIGKRVTGLPVRVN